jgi:hypothetical protein
MTQPLQTDPNKAYDISFMEEIDDEDVLLAIQKMRLRTGQLPRNTHSREREPDETKGSSEDQEDEKIRPGEIKPMLRHLSNQLPRNTHSREREPDETKGSSEDQEDEKIRPGEIKPMLGLLSNLQSRLFKGDFDSMQLRSITALLNQIDPRLQSKRRIVAAADTDASLGSTPDVVPIIEQINDLTAGFLDLFLDEKMNTELHDDSSLVSASTWDDDTLTLDETLSLNESVQVSRTRSFRSTSSGKSVAFLPTISSILSTVACQDNDIYRYDDRYDDAFMKASMRKDRELLSSLADDRTVLTELSEPPLENSCGPQVIPREVALTNSISSEMPKEGEDYKILGVSSEDIEHNEIFPPPSHSLEASKTPPRPKSVNSVQASSKDSGSVDQSDTSEVLSNGSGESAWQASSEEHSVLSVQASSKNGSVESVWPHQRYKTGKKQGVEEGDWNLPPTPSITLGNLRSASPLFVKQDTEEGSPVGTFMPFTSQSKGYKFDLTNTSFTFDDQSDGNCHSLAGGARSERPLVGASVSQIKGKTREQPNTVDTYANDLQSTRKAKGWKFDLTKSSPSIDGQNADADSQALLGHARSEGPVQATPTRQGADQPYDQLESDGIEVSSICDSKSFMNKGAAQPDDQLESDGIEVSSICDSKFIKKKGADQPDDQLESDSIDLSSICDSNSSKKKGWKVKWGRRGK